MQVQEFFFPKYSDNRGELYTVFDRRKLPDIEFVEDRVSKSKYGTIRAFHGDYETWKLVSCLHGSFDLVTFDLQRKEKRVFHLSAYSIDTHTVLIPPYFLNGHQCLSETCVLMYKWSVPYQGPDKQISVHYLDPTINHVWRDIPAIVSDRDKNALTLEEQRRVCV